MTIRAASAADMSLFAEWAEREGWNPGAFDGGCYRVVDDGAFLIGAFGGEDVALVSAVRYGAAGGGFGFLGFYIVRPDMRGRGFGWQMWRAAISQMASCAVIGLDGVAGQVDSYAKSGFVFAFVNIRREFAGGGALPAAIGKDGKDDGIVSLSALAFDDIAAYLLPFFPAPRPAFYRAWICQPEVITLGYLRGGKLAGVGVMRKCRSGRKVAPLFADDDGIADMLLRALKAHAAGGEPLFMDMPDVNPAAEVMARRYDMRQCFTIARMYKGKTPPLPTGRIYAITSPEIG
ncbi:MAG: GNAT family N-acetyltransferase [Gammaproteobacteria bacterium]